MNKKVTSLSVMTLLLLCVAMFPFFGGVINITYYKSGYFMLVVKYMFSIVKPHVQVFYTWMRDLPHYGIDFFCHILRSVNLCA